MKKYLVLKLQGAMQAWGGHTYENLRPSHLFPTRSGIIGLLGGCLGIDREDIQRKEALNKSFILAVRADRNQYSPIRMTDYHTVLAARKVDGRPRKDAVQSYREYLCDAHYTVVIEFLSDAEFSLEEIVKYLHKPVYTPILGRRSCPLQRPVFEKIVSAESFQHALKQIEPYAGTIYSEETIQGGTPMQVRDVPMPTSVRQFASRTVYVYGGDNVFE